MLHIYMYRDPEGRKRDHAWQHEMGERLLNYAGSLPENEELKFSNISHSGGYVVVALSDCPVGVDIEQDRPVSANVAGRAFSELEQQLIDSDKCSLTPLQLWTLKESYGKSEGVGICYPLRSVEFIPAKENETGQWIEFSCSAANAHCYSLKEDDYVLSACVQSEKNENSLPIVTKHRLDVT